MTVGESIATPRCHHFALSSRTVISLGQLSVMTRPPYAVTLGCTNPRTPEAVADAELLAGVAPPRNLRRPQPPELANAFRPTRCKNHTVQDILGTAFSTDTAFSIAAEWCFAYDGAWIVDANDARGELALRTRGTRQTGCTSEGFKSIAGAVSSGERLDVCAKQKERQHRAEQSFNLPRFHQKRGDHGWYMKVRSQAHSFTVANNSRASISCIVNELNNRDNRLARDRRALIDASGAGIPPGNSRADASVSQ
jgi:hypothetical protein